MCDNCCTPFIGGEGCSSALQKRASNIASGDYSVAAGHGTIASNEGELATGTYNKANQGQIFSVGVGTSDSNRMNALQINTDGSTSFLHNGHLVKLSDLIETINHDGVSLQMQVIDGYLKYSIDNGITWTNIIEMSELKGESGDNLEQVSAEIIQTAGGSPGVSTSFNNGVLHFVFSNIGGSGGTTPATLEHATDNALGGIKTGYSESGSNYAVKLDSNDRAYVTVPTGGGTTPSQPYELPTAGSNTLGGVKLGFNESGSDYALKVDGNSRAYVTVPGGGGPGTQYTLPAATASTLGGIKIGSGLNVTNDGTTSVKVATEQEAGGILLGFSDNTANTRNYPVQLSNNRAYVRVPWVASTGAVNGGYYETIFTITLNNVAPESSLQALQGMAIDDTSGTWRHYVADNNQSGDYYIWMANRWVDGDGTLGTWYGPWRISGADGDAGADGTDIEFIFTRTNVRSTPTTPTDSMTQASDSISKQQQAHNNQTSYQFADWFPVGWTDNPVGVEPNVRFEYMSFRMKTGGAGGQGGTWGDFIQPFLWSAYGESGTDGDGIEYIFFAGSTLTAAVGCDPTAWDKNTAGVNSKTWGDRDFIASAANNIWYDNPIDLNGAGLGMGTKQWVSIRKKYADNAANRSYYTDEADVTKPYWHAFSQPALWSYYPQDGDAGTGYVGDLDNEVMAAALDTNGNNYEFTQTTGVTVYNGLISLPTVFSSDPNDITITYSDDATNTISNTNFNGSSYSGQRNLVTVSGGVATIHIAPNKVNLQNHSLLIQLKAIGTVDANTNVERTVTLTIVGVQFGTDGSTYRLGLSHKAIHKSGNSIDPASIDVNCIRVSGLDTMGTYNATNINSSGLGLPYNFTFKYRINDTGNTETLSTSTFNTSLVDATVAHANVKFYLYYNTNILVDQETVYVVADGVSVDPNDIRFHSTVFKRASSKPSVSALRGVIKTGTVGESNVDENGYRTDYGGTFYDPVPYGWSDGVPAESGVTENDRLWMSTRTFCADGSLAAPYSIYINNVAVGWSEPVEAVDTNDYDIEFAFGDSTPANPTDANRHGGSGTQVWFDPTLDTNTNFTNAVWRAERYFRNGVWGDWVILKIKGENGAPGIDGDDGIDGENAIYLDLTNENDTMLYSGNTLISGSATSQAILYNGGVPVDTTQFMNPNIFSKVSSTGCTATVNSSTGVVEVTAMSAVTGEVVVGASYMGNTYTAVMTLKRQDSGEKYILVVAPNNITYNEDEDDLSHNSVDVSVNIGHLNANGAYIEESASSVYPSGYFPVGNDTSGQLMLRVNDNNVSITTGTGVNRITSYPISHTISVDPANDNGYDIRIVRRTRPGGIGTSYVYETLDVETVNIGTYSNGSDGADGKGISSIEVKYGVSSAENTLPSSWVDSMQTLSINPGYWVWTRIIYTYTDGTTSQPIYSKYRTVDVSDISAPVVVFRGVYDSQETYYGNTDRTDIVYFEYQSGGTTYNKYFRANPYAVSSSFTGQAPMVSSGGTISLNSDYWMDFGQSYDNIATGFAFIEDLVVRRLNTAGTGSSTKRIVAENNILSMFDDNNNEKMRISGGELSVVSSTVNRTLQASAALSSGTAYNPNFISGELHSGSHAAVVGSVAEGAVLNLPSVSLVADAHISNVSSGSIVYVDFQVGWTVDGVRLDNGDNQCNGTVTSSSPDLSISPFNIAGMSIPLSTGDHNIGIWAEINAYGDIVCDSWQYTVQFTNPVTFTIVYEIQKTEIAENGFQVRFDSDHIFYAGEVNNSIEMRMISDNYGIEVKDSGIRFKLGGSWYNTSRDSSTGALTLTVSS